MVHTVASFLYTYILFLVTKKQYIHTVSAQRNSTYIRMYYFLIRRNDTVKKNHSMPTLIQRSHVFSASVFIKVLSEPSVEIDRVMKSQ